MKFLSFKAPKKVLFVSAEAAPFVKVGGLGSVMDSLPRALRELNCDARVMIPKYLPIESKWKLSTVVEGVYVPTNNTNGTSSMVCNVKRFVPKKDGDPVMTYFLENEELYEKRSNVYGYSDDHVRWALLSRGVIEFLRLNKDWKPDIIVACDWQTGLIANYLKTEYKDDPLVSGIATVFSIHNLGYQGMFDHKFVQELDQDDGHSPVPGFDSERLGKINCMRRGIMYADMVTTVSPTYAREILTPQYGELLDGVLRERRNVLVGILNGIDYKTWNPKNDPYIVHPYGVDDVNERVKNKAVLQERMGLENDKNVFVIGIASRLSHQKGFDLLMPIADTLLNELPVQFAVVGTGDSDIMAFFRSLEAKYPRRVAAHLSFDDVLPHIIFAGADTALMPSRFEPCGLTQMEAMRMGAVPIVRETGGLADTVEDYDPGKDSGTGFTFEKYDSASLMIALIRAIENSRNKKEWQGIMRRAMQKDYSWQQSAKKYIDAFDRVSEIHSRDMSDKK